MNVHVSDVLIIGSGGAGLMAAIALHDSGAKVHIVGKCKKRDAHTTMATGGINAALGNMDPEDSWQQHAADTIKDGDYINDYHAVELLCRHAPEAVRQLAEWGVRFHREPNGKISQRFFGAATFRRACFVRDETGKEIINVLVEQAERRSISFFNEIYVFHLLHSKGMVNGALGIDLRTGALVTFHAKIIVLATGGHSRMFTRSSSRFWENNGDGVYLAYQQGASFMDMEMFQFHPTGMLWPHEADGLLVTEAVRGEGGILTNALGERFMEKYDPERIELSARDIVARAIFTEVREGRGTKRGGVWLDISHRPKRYILERLPHIYHQFMHYAHVDISRQKMEVAPTAHYSMGGVAVEHATGKTGVKNLYAVGEVTAGVHGGNRLGGNSLAEIMVFGRLTGKHIASGLKNTRLLPIDEHELSSGADALHALCSSHGRNPVAVKKELQAMMWHCAGVVRDKHCLEKGIAVLEAFRKARLHVAGSFANNEQLIAALDVRNMLPACEMILKSALLRTESRGAHYRSDFPLLKKAWLKNIICRPTAKGMVLTTKRVSSIPSEIRKLLKMKKADAKLLE